MCADLELTRRFTMNMMSPPDRRHNVSGVRKGMIYTVFQDREHQVVILFLSEIDLNVVC
jgi:hypothetical protein